MTDKNLGYVERSITAENQFTDPIETSGEVFNFSVSGTFVATVTIQRRFRTSVDPLTWTDWFDMETYTTGYEDIGFMPRSEKVQVRAGVKTGGFTSGTVVVRISR